MHRPNETATAKAPTAGDLCANQCGYYGNKIWDGYCSKCYREIYEKSKNAQERLHDRINKENSDVKPVSSIQSSPSFTNFEEKRRSNLNIRNPIRQMVYRAGSLRSSSNSMISALMNDEHAVEVKTANEYLDGLLTDDARVDIKSQVKTFINIFNKKCSSKTASIESLRDEYGAFFDGIKKRIRTNPIYRNENEDLFNRIRDYAEKIIFPKNYSSLFSRIATVCEEKDLSIQNRITSLQWITAPMLDSNLNEHISSVRESMFKAMSALMEIDSKTTPQGKIDSIIDCKTHTEDCIRSSTSTGINADTFLPALIYILLRAKPPRLHSNMQFLSYFSQPTGEQVYYLANLDLAVRFIELLQAEHLGLSSEDFSSYMQGAPVQPSQFGSLLDSVMADNAHNQQIQKNFILYHELDHHCEKFDENLVDFGRRLTEIVTDVRQLLHASYVRFPHIEKLPQLIDVETSEPSDTSTKSMAVSSQLLDILDQTTVEDEQLPVPLAPEIVSQFRREDN